MHIFNKTTIYVQYCPFTVTTSIIRNITLNDIIRKGAHRGILGVHTYIIYILDFS